MDSLRLKVFSHPFAVHLKLSWWILAFSGSQYKRCRVRFVLCRKDFPQKLHTWSWNKKKTWDILGMYNFTRTLGSVWNRQNEVCHLVWICQDWTGQCQWQYLTHILNKTNSSTIKDTIYSWGPKMTPLLCFNSYLCELFDKGSIDVKSALIFENWHLMEELKLKMSKSHQIPNVFNFTSTTRGYFSTLASVLHSMAHC